MSNALKVSGESDGHVFRKQASPAVWRSALGRHWKARPPLNTISASNRWTHIRQPAGVARA
jgi:hypothetical protein